MYVKKKILFVASVSDHIKAFHLPYLKWFQENGYETHVAANQPCELPYVDKFWKVDIERNPFSFNNLNAYFQLEKIISNENYKLISCHTPIASVITRLAAKKHREKGTKVVYMAHGFHFFKGASFINWALFYPVEKFLTQYTDAIITINSEDFNRIREKGSKKCNYFLVNGVGVSKQRFHPVSNDEKKQIKKELNIADNKTIFIYSGRLAKDKSHLFIINTVSKHKELFKDTNILFAGSGELDNFLKKKVQEQNVNDIIKFIGYRTDINRVYQASDYGLSASIREGLATNLIEEMFCGLPVIATRQRGHNEIVDSGINGFLFTINSEAEFIEIIKHLMSDRFNYEEFSKNAIQKAEKFELSKSLESIVTIYKQFIT